VQGKRVQSRYPKSGKTFPIAPAQRFTGKVYCQQCRLKAEAENKTIRAKIESDAMDLKSTVQLLKALQDPTRSDHALAMQTLLQSVNADSAFISTILLIFSRGGDNTDISIRQLAGLIVKNYVFPNLAKLTIDVQVLLKSECINALSDSSTDIR
jgi:hypothetical protein